MNRNALGPADKIETFTPHELGELAPGVLMRLHFASFGPIERGMGVTGVTAITIKLSEFVGERGVLELYEVSYGPFINYDIAQLSLAAQRAAAFVDGARRVDYSTLHHSDYVALAQEVA